MPRFKARKGDNMDTAAQVLQLAQQTAEQAIADAQREAEEIRSRARQEAEQIIADAKARAQRILKRVRQTPGHAAACARPVAAARPGRSLCLPGPGSADPPDSGSG